MWDQRTDRLLRIVAGGRGPIRTFDRKYRDRIADELVGAAISAMKRRRGVWPRGIEEHTIRLPNRNRRKIEHMKRRYFDLGAPRHFVYAFYRYGRCLKVGRTEKGFGRITQYQDTVYLRDATSLWIAVPGSATRRSLPQLECLAHHFLDPKRNAVAPTRPPYRKRCPICSVERELRELVEIFRFRD